MIRFMFSVFDSAAQVFGQPFLQPTAEAAIRAVSDEVNRVGSVDVPNPLNGHSDDFSLHQLGLFDDVKGELRGEVDGPRLVARCKDLVR